MDYERFKKLEFKDHNDREVQGAYDEKVLEAFQKFDTDGSGKISRDELAEVRWLLKTAAGFPASVDSKGMPWQNDKMTGWKYMKMPMYCSGRSQKTPGMSTSAIFGEAKMVQHLIIPQSHSKEKNIYVNI